MKMHSATLKHISPGADDAIVKQYNALLDNLNAAVLDRFSGHDYSVVFEKYIQA